MYSQPVTLNLALLFAHLHLDKCTETTLTANQKACTHPILSHSIPCTDSLQLSDVHRFVWNVESVSPAAPGPATHDDAFTVTILPMQIRTWSCAFARV